jgi:murein DD-endopeptidase MepM/ murein hydrolase activator NlpD
MISFLISVFINHQQPNLSSIYKEDTPANVVASSDLIYPLKQKYPVSSPYGMRNGRMHRGVDIAASYGLPVIASHSGKVVAAGAEAFGSGYGNVVVIEGLQHHTLYAHLSKVAVNAGDEVKQGQYLGDIGESGNARGPHLHYEIRVLTKTKAGLRFELVNPASVIKF